MQTFATKQVRFRIVLILVITIIAIYAITIATSKAKTCAGQPIILFSYLEQPFHFNNWYLCKNNPTPARFEPGFVDISPDEKWLLFLVRDAAYSPTELFIRQNGHVAREAEIQWNDAWESNPNYIHWVDNDHVSIRLFDEDRNIAGTVHINPWTGDQRAIQPEFVELGGADSFYNTDSTYVIYALRTRFFLYNIQEASVVWELDDNYSMYATDPAWSPGGSQFVYVRPVRPPTEVGHRTQELFLVSVSGEEMQITDLSRQGTKPSHILSPVWSPDEKHVVFWWSNDEPQTVLQGSEPEIVFSLTMLDVETQKVTTFKPMHPFSGAFDLVWSPDSDAVAAIGGLGLQEQSLFIVDIRTGECSQIAERVSGITAWCICLP